MFSSECVSLYEIEGVSRLVWEREREKERERDRKVLQQTSDHKIKRLLTEAILKPQTRNKILS